MKIKSTGICALTKESGKYVKSHILPRALTKISEDGDKIIEAGIGRGKTRRLDTWYDNQLCIQAGESILERIDTRGIDLLRSLKLVWSGWNTEDASVTETQWDVQPITEYVRTLNIADEAAIRLFLLSIIWRASASQRHEFSEFKLSFEEEEDLRNKILSEDPGDPNDFPILLFQISTRGISHNRTPILEERATDETGLLVTHARVYFDGFICYITLPRGVKFTESQKHLFLGNNAHAFVFLNKFEESRTHDNMIETIQTVENSISSPPSKRTAIFTAIQEI